jgi:hypothetical protein
MVIVEPAPGVSVPMLQVSFAVAVPRPLGEQAPPGAAEALADDELLSGADAIGIVTTTLLALLSDEMLSTWIVNVPG